jgi:hypothetical protein
MVPAGWEGSVTMNYRFTFQCEAGKVALSPDWNA